MSTFKGDVYVVGAGAGGTRLIEKMVKKVPPKRVLVIDGDVFEDKNLERQIFPAEYLGVNKAIAMSQMYGVRALPEFYYHGILKPKPGDVFFCMADNNACRAAVLETCDAFSCMAFFAAHERETTQAYVYTNAMKGTPNDPRILYPGILTDHSGDPLGPPGCVEAMQTPKEGEEPGDPLLVDLNVSFALCLFNFWTKVKPTLEPWTKPRWPVAMDYSSASGLARTVHYEDRLPVLRDASCVKETEAAA